MEGTGTHLLTVAALTVSVSMLVAVVIKLIVFALGRSAARTGTPQSPPLDSVAAAALPEPPEEHVAVIAAAVSVVFDDGVQIVHIEPSRADTAWSASGRQTLHTSHHLGPRTPRRPSAPRAKDNQPRDKRGTT